MPGQSRSVALVESILEAAARILEAEGFGGYSTNAIAARAGVSVGLVYQYFPGRDAITRALITRETNAFLAELGAPRPANNGVEQIKAMITTAVTHQLKRPALARLLDIEEERLPLGSDVEAARGQMRTAVAEVINAPEFAGRLRHPKEADDLLAIVKGMVDAAGQGGEKDADDLCQRVERAVFGYLGVAAM